MHPISVLVAAAMAAATSLPARADVCAAVADAYGRLAAVQAYRETVSMPNLVTLEMVAIGDMLYVKQGLDWQKVPLEPGMRAKMIKRIIPDAASLKACAAAGTETIDGQAMAIYDYTPPAVEGIGDPGPQRVWIGAGDGLPHRLLAERQKADIRLSFDGVKAPIP
jgi:hypothetical protein